MRGAVVVVVVVEDAAAVDGVTCCPLTVVPVVLPVVPVLFVVVGRVVVVRPAVVSLPPRSPGCAIARITPPTSTTVAAIKRSRARLFSGGTLRWEGRRER